MTLQSDIVAFLIAQGYGSTANIFEWNIPDKPTEAIVVIPYGGPAPQHFYGSSDAIEYPCFQIQVRSATVKTAHDKAAAIEALLDGKKDLAGYISIFSAHSGIDYLGREGREDGFHVKFAVSFNVIKMN
jgi:hypothetical protein